MKGGNFLEFNVWPLVDMFIVELELDIAKQNGLEYSPNFGPGYSLSSVESVS